MLLEKHNETKYAVWENEMKYKNFEKMEHNSVREKMSQRKILCYAMQHDVQTNKIKWIKI